MKALNTLIVLALVVLCSSTLFAQTGKISGTVTDSRTGEALISANVIIEGTTLGAATNLDGYFVILNVPPGTYNVRTSMIGYTASTQTGVRVLIDQSTNVDFSMVETVFQTEEVVVVADRPVVQRDVSGSVVNISPREIESIPISQVESVIGLQPGIRGLSVRRSGEDELAVIVDGLTLRDERDNSPYTGISVLALEDIQIKAGGFNAEYGNVRSGVVNLATKEGGTAIYNVGFVGRYSPPAKKYFGMQPNNFNSYWIRPYLDDAVAWTGTSNGAWDEFTQRQYEVFAGWNKISQNSLSDSDPTNDLSPQAAQQLFLWQHRKSFDITEPDYDFDIGFGGPVPFARGLGNLRFFSSFRWLSREYAVPLARSGYSDYSASLKLTSDVAPGMKVMVDYLFGRNEAVDRNRNGTYNTFTSTSTIGASMNRVSYIDTRLFATDYWNPNSRDITNVGVKFTHAISSNTYYEVIGQWFASRYSSGPGRIRNTSRYYLFGDNYLADEAPFGFSYAPPEYSKDGIDGKLRMGVGFSNARDSSGVDTYRLKFDITSQLDRFNEVKSGIEFVYTDNRVNYGLRDSVLPDAEYQAKWRTTPTRFSAYVQDKLEFEGLVVNLGLRFDMSHAGGDWYRIDDPYTNALAGARSLGIDTLLPKDPTKRITHLSPRLGIAFPISVNSKLYFNYGHFRQMPFPENLFLIRRQTATQNIERLADPNLPLQKTVQYELGYDHNLFDMMLLRVAAYYKDVSDQSLLVRYTGYGGSPNYTQTSNNSYEDIRGFEISLNKNRGDWFQGWINYTYEVISTGGFGKVVNFESPTEQRTYDLNNPDQFQQNRPLPQPYARANVTFFTPFDYGPQWGELYPLGSWRLNLLGAWSSGTYFTWVGGGAYPGITNNIQWKDQWSFDLRVSKDLKFGPVNLQVFADIYNVFNLKQLTTYGFTLGSDYSDYMKSLHLPEEFNRFGYGNIPGDDGPGDYRQPGTDFQPLSYADNIAAVTNPSTRAYYFNAADRQYYQYVGGNWQLVDQGRINDVLDKKAYIDMPNQEWFNFIDPRDVYFGIRLSFDF